MQAGYQSGERSIARSRRAECSCYYGRAEDTALRKLIGGLLVLMLAMPVHARELTVVEQAGKIKLGAKMEVTLQTNEVLTGRMGPLSSTGFSLEPVKAGQGTARAMEFQDVKRVRRTGMNTAEKVAIISVAAVGALALSVYLWAKASGC
ncbi:MAG TPA: hypothetical protein VN841_09460 [Bryobacteraceae bacterium]|nr:hypothetical protein [Bryobacteraceae bacterium]